MTSAPHRVMRETTSGGISMPEALEQCRLDMKVEHLVAERQLTGAAANITIIAELMGDPV